MSPGTSYRLETPRPRQPPAPLQFEHSTFRTSSSLSSSDRQNSQTLLYDLPSTTSMSPPITPRSRASRLISPTSPSFSGRSRTPLSGRPTPPPSARNRSTTPLGVAPSDLERFAEYCRAWYFNQDDESGRLMTQTLATLPPAQRAPFSRLQASMRSAYHRSVNARRTAEFRAHLSATQPGGSLMPHSRAEPRGALATKERHERMERFVRNWCTMGMPGTKPFFEALWAVMRLQVIPENLGGAGGFRIEWEFDDAVFKEAAGKDFMLEAIDVLKGVLGFEEALPAKNASAVNDFDSYPTPTTIHARSQSQPLSSNPKAGPATTIQPKRSRAPSDPFLDSPALSQAAVAPSASSTPALLAASTYKGGVEPPSPFSVSGADFDDTEEQYLRTWTAPDLSNPEYLELLKLFPTFISRSPLPRFPVLTNRRLPDLEEGDDEALEGKQIQCGTGSMWLGSKQRSDGWQGGWWTRFVLWWRRVFC